MATASCPSPWKGSMSIFFLPPQVLIKSLWSFLSSGLNNPRSLCLFLYYQCSRFLVVFVALSWTLSAMPMSLRSCFPAIQTPWPVLACVYSFSGTGTWLNFTVFPWAHFSIPSSSSWARGRSFPRSTCRLAEVLSHHVCIGASTLGHPARDICHWSEPFEPVTSASPAHSLLSSSGDGHCVHEDVTGAVLKGWPMSHNICWLPLVQQLPFLSQKVIPL